MGSRGFSSFDDDSFFSGSFGFGGLGMGLFRAHSLFDDDEFFSSKKRNFPIGRGSSFGTDLNTDHLDRHPALKKSTSMTTKTM